MKLKKILFSVIALTCLATCSMAANTNQVKAASFNYYSTGKGFSHLKHKVVLTRPITIRKTHFYKHSFYTYLKERKVLPAGTQIKILPYGDKGYYWLISYGKFSNGWVYPPKTTDWFDTYQKHVLIDTGLFHGAKKRSGKIYDFSWSQYCKLVRMGLWDLPTHPNRNKKINQQIKAWNLKAE